MLLRCLAIGLLITLISAFDTAAAPKTARDKNELAGPVRSVVTMTPGFSEAVTYDRTGNLIETVIYRQHESRSTRYVFTYDRQGTLQEEHAYDAGDTMLYRKLFAYAHDAAGRETAVVAALQDGEFHHAELSTYDRYGTLSETIDTDGTTTSRNLFDVLGRRLYSGRYRGGQLLGEFAWTYDNNGRLIALTSYSLNGAVTGTVLHEYDEEAGRRIRTTTETVQHGATSRWITTYEYDSAGNWIKELTRKELSTPSDTETLPSQITQQRLIDYYEIP